MKDIMEMQKNVYDDICINRKVDEVLFFDVSGKDIHYDISLRIQFV